MTDRQAAIAAASRAARSDLDDAIDRIHDDLLAAPGNGFATLATLSGGDPDLSSLLSGVYLDELRAAVARARTAATQPEARSAR